MTLPNLSLAHDLRPLELLRQRYPTITAAHAEMINLHAILALPKGTDRYISDIHGAYEHFDHILHHASGDIRRKISQTFGTELNMHDQVKLVMLISYTERQLRQLQGLGLDVSVWMVTTIGQLIRIARTC